jgi:hypothetical protein
VANDNTLDNIWISSEALVTLEFRKSLVDGYKADPYYRRVLRMLAVEDLTLTTLKDKVGVPFVITNGLIYHATLKGPRRLCIPGSVI